MNKIQKEYFTPTVNSIKNKDLLKKTLKDNLNDYITIYNSSEKENKVKNKESIKKYNNYRKRKNKSENT